MNIRAPLMLLAALAAGSAQAQGVYKWVDEQGRVQYSDAPPDKGKANLVPCPPPPTEEQVKEAQERHERSRKALEAIAPKGGEVAPKPGGTAPGQLPRNEVSEYMRTVATSVGCDVHRPAFRFTILLQLHQDVPVGTLLEAEFENPADPQRPLTASATIGTTGTYPQRKEDRVMLESPEFEDIRCGHYKVVVQLYRDAKRRELIGTHEQLILSRYDRRAWRSADDWIERMLRDKQVCQ